MKTVARKRTRSLKQPLKGLKRNRITTMIVNLKINTQIKLRRKVPLRSQHRSSNNSIKKQNRMTMKRKKKIVTTMKVTTKLDRPSSINLRTTRSISMSKLLMWWIDSENLSGRSALKLCSLNKTQMGKVVLTCTGPSGSCLLWLLKLQW